MLDNITRQEAKQSISRAIQSSAELARRISQVCAPSGEVFLDPQVIKHKVQKRLELEALGQTEYSDGIVQLHIDQLTSTK